MRERIPTCTPMFRACMAGRFARDLLYVNRLNPFIQERSLLSYGAVEQQMSEEERMRWGCRCCCGQQVAACWPACPDADNSGSITPPPASRGLIPGQIEPLTRCLWPVQRASARELKRITTRAERRADPLLWGEMMKRMPPVTTAPGSLLTVFVSRSPRCFSDASAGSSEA